MSASVTIAMIFTVKMRNDRAFVRSAKAGVVLVDLVGVVGSTTFYALTTEAIF